MEQSLAMDDESEDAAMKRKERGGALGPLGVVGVPSSQRYPGLQLQLPGYRPVRRLQVKEALTSLATRRLGTPGGRVRENSLSRCKIGQRMPVVVKP